MMRANSTPACVLILAIVSQLLISIPIKCHAPKKDIPKTLNFGTYVEKFGKSYGRVEAMARAKLFYARTLAIFQSNVQYLSGKTHYYLEQNSYTDMTLKDIKQRLAITDSDFVPVAGAERYPDMPADKLVSGQLDHEASVSDLESELKDQVAERLNFFDDSNTQHVGMNPRELVQELASNSDMADVISKLVDEPDANDSEQGQPEIKDIPFKGRIEPENKYYNPEMVHTNAWAETLQKMGENYAKAMMDNYLDDMQDYSPSDKIVTDDGQDPFESETSPLFARLSGSLKDLYDRFKSNADGDIVDPVRDETEKAQVGQQKDDQGLDKVVRLAGTSEPPVYDIDWRRSGCVSRPKHQRDCNACYVLGALDIMEFYYCKQKKVRTEFSPQYLIDCGDITSLNGCSASRLANVGSFIMQYGLQLETHYPYKGEKHVCPYVLNRILSDDSRKSYSFKPKIEHWATLTQMSDWTKWLPHTPLIVGINMPTDIFAYKGGVHDGLVCSKDVVHAMLLVGSGKQNGVPFWLLKNTLSDTWGDKGYFKLSKKAPLKCFNSAILAVAKFQ